MKTSSQMLAIITLVLMTGFAAVVAYLQYRHIYLPPVLVGLAELAGGYVLSQCRALAAKNSGVLLPGIPLEHLPTSLLASFKQQAASALAALAGGALTGQTLMGASPFMLYQPPAAASAPSAFLAATSSPAPPAAEYHPVTPGTEWENVLQELAQSAQEPQGASVPPVAPAYVAAPTVAQMPDPGPLTEEAGQ